MRNKINKAFKGLLSTLALTLIGMIFFGGKAYAANWTEITGTIPAPYVNTFEGGTISTRIGPGTFVGAQFNNAYEFTTLDPGTHHSYATTNSANINPTTMNTGRSAGVSWADASAYGHHPGQVSGALTGYGVDTMFAVSNEHWYVDTTVPTRNEYKYTATLKKDRPGQQTYTLDYQVITTTLDDGEIKHDVTVTNKSGVPLPEDIVMSMDTSLDGNDDIPVYATGGGRMSGYMKLPASGNIPELRFTMKGNSGIKTMYLGLWSSFNLPSGGYNVPLNAVVKHDVTTLGRNQEVVIRPDQTFRNDSAVFYVVPTKNLANNASLDFSYSETLTMSRGTSGFYDENGNGLLEVEGPQVTPGQGGTPFGPLAPPEIPGYMYSYAQAYGQDVYGEYTELQSDILHTTEGHTDTDPVGVRTTMSPVYGIRSSVIPDFRVKFFYRPVNNKDATPPVINTTPDKPKPDVPTTKPDTETKPDVPTLTPVAKKGEPVYNVNKIGLYRDTNFNKSNRIKAYAKRTRVNRYEFIVKGYGHSKSGALRYYVQQYNPYKNRYVPGTKGYITASSKYVVPVYYKSTGTKRVRVINARGVKAYTNKQLTSYKKHYKRGTTLKIQGVVKQKYTTRFKLSNGLYITANKKFVIFK